MVVRRKDLIFAVEIPPSGVCRMRRLTIVSPCNMRRRVVGCHAKAAQAVPGILVQVQLQIVDVLVGCAVTGEDQLRKLDCAKVERRCTARDAVIHVFLSPDQVPKRFSKLPRDFYITFQRTFCLSLFRIRSRILLHPYPAHQ